jgi:hypothetical protein
MPNDTWERYRATTFGAIVAAIDAAEHFMPGVDSDTLNSMQFYFWFLRCLSG